MTAFPVSGARYDDKAIPYRPLIYQASCRFYGSPVRRAIEGILSLRRNIADAMAYEMRHALETWSASRSVTSHEDMVRDSDLSTSFSIKGEHFKYFSASTAFPKCAACLWLQGEDSM